MVGSLTATASSRYKVANHVHCRVLAAKARSVHTPEARPDGRGQDTFEQQHHPVAQQFLLTTNRKSINYATQAQTTPKGTL